MNNTDTLAGTVSPAGVRYLPDGKRTFEHGNGAALKHGAYASKLIAPVAAEMERGIAELVAGTPAEGPAFAAARATLALRCARLLRVSTWIDEECGGLPMKADGEPLHAARLEAQLAAAVDKSLGELGLTPASAARLGVDLMRGTSLAAEMEGALAARERADARMREDAP